MAREPSSHYKAISAEVEMLRKRENGNMKRIKALEDKLGVLTAIMCEAGIIDKPMTMKPTAASQPPTKQDYKELTRIVLAEKPELISLWGLVAQYGFASHGTVEAILKNANLIIEASAEVGSRTISAKFSVQELAEKEIERVIGSSKVCLEFDEDGSFKSGALMHPAAARKNGSPGKFRFPVETPKEWVIPLARNEMLREGKRRNIYDIFLQSYASTYGVALGLSDGDCREILDDMIARDEIIKDGIFIKAA